MVKAIREMPSGCKLLVSDNFFHFENAQVEKLCEFDKGPFINYVVSFGREGGGHCVFKWILCGHLKPTPSATI